jgi:esterase/lipase superfamily enzyme
MKKILGLIAIMTIATAAFTYAQKKTDAALNQVLTAYYDVKNALATDKKDVAIEKAKILSAKVNAVNHKDLPADEHKTFMEQAAIIKSKSAQLAGSNNIKTQRKAFEEISYAMIKTLKSSQTVYVQHCPMAKASWLNEKENIENPYYGSMMFDCGDVSETIKSK